MTTISSNPPAALHVPLTKPAAGGKDSDGDNDGSGPAAAQPPAPVVSNPTATMGNYVNTHA